VVEKVAGVMRLSLLLRPGGFWSSCEDLEIGARAAIHAVADWLQQRSNTIANGSQWAEMLRREADR
jgi:hypothetical protein